MCHCLRKQQSRLVPAQAGTQETRSFTFFWIPAFAGMTHWPLTRPLPQEGEAYWTAACAGSDT